MAAFKGKISKTAWMAADETQKVMAALLRNGGEARFVGGCVRDALCNRKVIDIDIATPLKPDDVIARLVAAKINYAPTGLKHGTVTAICDGRPFEITTLRRDVMTYGRHADVAFTDDWHVDASRRDFTINAMSMTVEGEVDDPFGGIEDLRLGRVVFVGDAETRIREDVLRILRFFRFYAHYGRGPADARALAACAKLAPEIPKLSAERIRQETLRIFEARACAQVWDLMLENRVATYFLPEATNTAALHRLVALEEKYESPGHALRRLAAVITVTPAGFTHVAQSLRLSNAQAQQLEIMTTAEDWVSVHMDHAEMRRLVYRRGNDMARNLLLLAAARSGDTGDFTNLYNWATAFRAPRFPLEGNDVIDLGWKPGPDVGRILGMMEQWWLEQDFAPGRTLCLDRLRRDHRPRSRG